ncbi:uncharacterized protein LOC133792634 [Humulus lupulus]|uniref:uncharacterized protein LOC133792634 n=1 Tax=Humulus lupulus TaxID=3486 RepID=UPI002B40EE0C|nr:uncharacterized protein LOC133792634 [Humulus lupulus]
MYLQYHYNVQLNGSFGIIMSLKIMEFLSFLVTFVVLRLSLSRTTFAVVDTIRPSEFIRHNTTLVSGEGLFALGFFSPGSSKNHYLGIWYTNIPVQTVVWVANRCEPINDSSASLTIDDTGNLVLYGQNKRIVWPTNSTKQAREPLVQLLDNGNLVLRDEKDENTENYLWESFDYPTDTALPGMKFGWDLRRGLNRRLSAWKSWDDPCDGDLTYGMELDERHHTYPQLIMRKGSAKNFRAGSWNGISFGGNPDAGRANALFEYGFVYNDDEVYYVYELKGKSVISKMVMNETSVITRGVLNQTKRVAEFLVWIESKKIWETNTSAPRDKCDVYGLCGANSVCVETNNPVCQCLKRFKPKNQEKWKEKSWLEGCVRNNPLSCHDKEKDGFIRFSNLKVPDTEYTWVNKSMDLEECRVKCLSNCSCMAYTNLDISEKGRGCVLWFGDFFDIREFQLGGQDLYIRMPASEIARTDVKVKVGRALIITAIIVALVGGRYLVGFYIHKRRNSYDTNTFFERNKTQDEDLELPLFDMHTISTATNNFSENNKLGEGGFGPVYKGLLEGGQEIAVKRLSMCSGQGVDEFKNEIKLIAKLQHRNLVKIFGYCIHREDKLLIYEYMPNKSLDYFIFDERQSRLILWPKRFEIICGIAKGLLYLHHDSRLRIIHRDLKASNVLLDEAMIPKISDFGLARAFGGDQIEGNTNKVVGTYGYMAPEYAFNGLFSIKSDVFSFGILMLEIVSGKKGRGFYDENSSLNLVGLAWTLMKEGNAFELVDKCLLEDPYNNMEEALRCIHIGLLCVQQNSIDRPNMSSVILMLSGERVLPQPKPPAYFADTDLWKGDHSSSGKTLSCNTCITDVEPKVVAYSPAMLFMKGTPDAPSCGFSEARTDQSLFKLANLISALLQSIMMLYASMLVVGRACDMYWPQVVSSAINKIMEFLSFLVTFVVLRLSLSRTTFAVVDTIRPSEFRGHNTTLVSKEGLFELGFFTPGSSKNRYLGIWYKNIPNQTVVWVANRCEPINDSSGSLAIDDTGNLVLYGLNMTVVWSTNSSKQARQPLVQLLDSGNLVLRDEKDENTDKYLWESFDYPTDTMIPGMKLGWDLRRGLNRRLSSWKSWDDPCDGDFTYGIELDEPHHSYPQLFIRNGSAKFFREGPWDGISFNRISNNGSVPLHETNYEFVHNEDEVYFTYSVNNESMIFRIVLGERIEYKKWKEEDKSWSSYYSVPGDKCDKYGICGANSECVINEVNKPICQCLEGFKPKNQENWNTMYWSEGCERISSVSCDDKDEFLELSHLKLPDTQSTWVNKSMNLGQCKTKCLSDCPCMAYSYTHSNISEGSDCVLWFGDLFDIRQLPYGGESINIRIAPKYNLEKATDGMDEEQGSVIIMVISLLVVLLSGGFLYIGFYMRRMRYINAINNFSGRNESQDEDLELPLFDLHTISTATNNFSENNKLGEGSFGPVYKGTLEGGQEIAVKMLTMWFGQGVDEFKSLIKLIAKLQHQNLVKIYGYCIHREIKLLIYEYMSNKSLDYVIFDERQDKLLEWPKRFQIACGIAKGLLYLHHDSRSIIHRNLKASNVLLDEDMNPKISDFGLTRTFNGNQIEGNTNIVGTFGYMAPEYASDSLFSIKSDVFSFGTMMLEIVSGKKSIGLYDENNDLNLYGFAWTLMKEGNKFKLIDKCLLKDLSNNDNMEEALRCIHIGLLCVQQKPIDRPNMSSVILMLSGDEVLPQPNPPAYFTTTDLCDGNHSSLAQPPPSDTSIIAVEAR